MKRRYSYLNLVVLAIVGSMAFNACTDNAVSGIDNLQHSGIEEEEITEDTTRSGSSEEVTQTANVFKSDASVLAYDPILVPNAEQFKNGLWQSMVCQEDGTGVIGLDDPRWTRTEGQTAYNMRPRLQSAANPMGLHPFEQWHAHNHPSNFGEADWINAEDTFRAIDINPEGENHIWTRYEIPVDGNGDFVLRLLADNCSWIFIDDQMVGFQAADISDPNKLTYGVTLNGPATLTYIQFTGGALTGGKFRLETTTEVIPPFQPPVEPNIPPVADAGSDQTLEATGQTTSVVLDGSGSFDPDGDVLTYEWSNGATNATTIVELGVGTHTFTLTVTDADGDSDSDQVTITIIDTTAPELFFEQLTGSLWPPNHQMVQVARGISAWDIVDGEVSVSVTVSSNEPVNGRGDGNTDYDYEVKTNPDGTIDVYVRAERSGGGNGRIYTIEMNTSDVAGNSASASFEVNVPHNRGRGR